MKPTLVALLAFGAGLATGTTWLALRSDQPSTYDVGGALLDVAPEEIKILSYASEHLILTAQRLSGDDPFAVQVSRAERKDPERCVTPHDLGGILAALSRVRVRNVISERSRSELFPSPLGYIEVRDAVYGEPSAPWLIFESKDHGSIAITVGARTYETDLLPATIEKLTRGCAALSPKALSQVME